jgi:hypothetical protein
VEVNLENLYRPFESSVEVEMEVLNVNEEDNLPGAESTNLGWAKERMEMEIVTGRSVFRKGVLSVEGMVVIFIKFVNASSMLKPATFHEGVDRFNTDVKHAEGLDINFRDDRPIDLMRA